MTRLAEALRRQYQVYQPVMWKKARDSETVTRRFFAKLVEDPATTALVCEIAERVDGFLIAREIPTPPVFDPGGATILVDDFCVREPSLWQSVGRDLLRALTAGRKPGWRQVMVVSAHSDDAKAAMLAEFGLTIASTWWTAPLAANP